MMWSANLAKNSWIFVARGVMSDWYGCMVVSKIFLAAWMESVMRVMCLMSSMERANSRPMRMAMISASVDEAFMACICNLLILVLACQMCDMAVMVPFLTPPSAMIQVCDGDEREEEKVFFKVLR